MDRGAELKLVAGVDGCRCGWFYTRRALDGPCLKSGVFQSAEELLASVRELAVLAIDIPIGLTEAGRRACDDDARKLLGWPRRNSVFPAPVRAALVARTREEASTITFAKDGRKVGTQAWAIYPKIREIDEALRALPPARRCRVVEVHPEVCFWAWQGGKPMLLSKKVREGRAKREQLVARHFGARVFAEARARFLKKDVASDDILDAFAALWTAERIARGEARCLPERPPRDAVRLPMRIVY